MNYVFKSSIFIFPFILSACSSPPKPQSVDWSSKAESLNRTLPEWNESGSINASTNVDGKWIKTVKDFDINKTFSVGIYYAVAHSTRIIVKTNSSQRWFDTKAWLRSHGANGVINFEYTKECITCNSVNVSFYRGFPVKPANPLYPVPDIKKEVTQPVAGSTKKLLAANVDKKPELLKDDKKPEPLKGFVTPVITPPLATAKAEAKNPFGTTPVNKPVIVPVKVAPPLKHWSVAPGTTLKETFLKWAAKEKCPVGNGKWSVNWDTDTNYDIDYPLSFSSANFEDVTRQLFNLYKNAQAPLYVSGYRNQCLIVISDRK